MRDFLLTSIFLVVLWTCIHLLARRYRQKSILPLTYHAGSQRQHVGHYEFQLKGVHTKLVTTVYNAFHERMCETFASQQRLAASLRVFYDIGTLFAYIGLIGGTLVVAYQGASLLAFATSSGPSTSLGKRDGLEIEQAASGMPLTLIIPGITVPMSHLPIILFAVFVSQAYHELGHAFSAALDSVTISSIGLSLTLVFPAAFVALPTEIISSSPSRIQARIISAGPWHNLSAWFLVFLIFPFVGLHSEMLLTPSYRDISEEGRMVVSSDYDSPLAQALPPGTIVHALDDASLSGSRDTWTEYLLEKDRRPQKGWCTSESTTLYPPKDCCDAVKSSETLKTEEQANLSCFVEANTTHNLICANPIPILTAPGPVLRCTTSSDCISASSKCIMPDVSSQLLRIRVVYPEETREDIILWKGPREEVWEQVELGRYYPRLWFIPVWFPRLLSLYCSYLEMALLSLYFVNLLPLPMLDGGQLIKVGLSVYRRWRGARAGRNMGDDFELLEEGMRIS